jgi:hypothetical protein
LQHYNKTLTKLVLLSLFLFSSVIFADPETVNLKISISDDTGPFEGIKRVDVSLFDDITDTGWTEIHKEITFSSGAAELELGEENALLSATLIRMSSPNFRLKIDGIESIVTFAPSASPYAIDIPTLWTGTLLGTTPNEVGFSEGVIHPDWIIGGVTQPDEGDGDGDGTLDADEVRDIVKGMVEGNTETGIVVDTSGAPLVLDFDVSESTISSDDVREIIKVMVEGNTENGIVVDTSSDPLVLDFDVADPTITFSGFVSGNATLTNLSDLSITTTMDSTAVIPIANGGTGATNASDARDFLEFPPFETFTDLVEPDTSTVSGHKFTGNIWFNVAYFSTLNFREPSDINLKENIIEIPSVLDKLKGIRGVYYNWNDLAHSKDNYPTTRQIGVIAQEIEEEFPELVGGHPNGYKSVNYVHLTPILLQAIKEQQAQIENLEERLQALEDAQ